MLFVCFFDCFVCCLYLLKKSVKTCLIHVEVGLLITYLYFLNGSHTVDCCVSKYISIKNVFFEKTGVLFYFILV